MTAPRHVDVGAYVLGILDAPDEAAYEEHFAQCERCRREFIEMADLPAILDTMKPAKNEPSRAQQPALPPLDALIDFRQLAPPGQVPPGPAVPPQLRPAGATQPNRIPSPEPTNGRHTNGSARGVGGHPIPAPGADGTGRHTPVPPKRGTGPDATFTPRPESTGRSTPAPRVDGRNPGPPRTDGTNRPRSTSRAESTGRSTPVPRDEATGRSTPLPRPESTGRSMPVSRAESTGRSTPVSRPESTGRSAPVSRPESTGRSTPVTRAESTGRSAPVSRAESTGRPAPVTRNEATGRSTPVTRPEATGRSAPVSRPEGTGRSAPVARRGEVASRPSPAKPPTKPPTKPPSKPHTAGPTARRRSRNPVWLAAAAVVAVALSVGMVIGLTSGGPDGGQVADPGTSAPETPTSGAVAGAHVVSGTDAKSGVTGIITIEPVADGTEIDVALYEVSGPQEGEIFVVSRFGDRERIAAWSATDERAGGKAVHTTGVSAFAQHDISRFEVHGDGIEPLLVVSI